MSLTPRQVSAYLSFNQFWELAEQANTLGITALGAQGDGKAIQQTLNKLNADQT